MIKRFISYYKPHKLMFSLDMLAAVIIAVCNLVYPKIAQNIINDYVKHDSFYPIVIAAVALLGVYLVKMLCTYVVGYYGHLVGVRMQANMRRDLFKKYQSLPYSYFDNHKTGDLLSRLTSDLQDVSELAHHGPENLFLAVLMFIGSFIMLSSINITLTLIMFCVVPFIVIFSILSRRSMYRAMKNSRKQMSVINSTLENSVTGIRETKAYVNEHREICKFDGVNRQFAIYRGDAMRALGRFDAVMTFLSDLLYFVIILAGGLFLYFEYIDGGEFAAFLLYINMFLNPINRFVSLFQQLQEGMSGFSRFCEIMDAEDEVDGGSVEIEDIKGDVRFDGVTFAYTTEGSDHKPVIKDLSLSVSAGQTLALVGPSGGGKSTLCNLIPRFYPIDGGSITIDGVDIRDITLHSLRKNIGIVSQNVFLFDGTVRDNISFGTENADDDAIIDAAKKANIHDFIMSLPEGYDTQVGERGVKLSGGQRQRISIARVFIKNPKLLILDEATSALDNMTEMLIQSALEELARGRTVIVVAHRLSTVKNADRIVVIDEGGILEEGTHEELLSIDGEYRRLYAYQFRE